MAYEIIAWAYDNNTSEIELDSTRINRISEIEDIVKEYIKDPECIKITKNRTECIANCTVIWTRPGYKDTIDNENPLVSNKKHPYYSEELVKDIILEMTKEDS